MNIGALNISNKMNMHTVEMEKLCWQNWILGKYL